MPLDSLNRQELRTVIKSHANILKPSGDFIIKTLRADKDSFFKQFITGIVPPNIKVALRWGLKKKCTVTGLGSFLRSEKKSQYSAIEKINHSKAQPASLGWTEHHPPAFGLDRSKDPVL